MSQIRGVLLGALLALVTVVPANALLIVQSTPTGGPTYFGKSFGGSFQKFNPALGTLQSVSLDISGDVTFYVDLTLPPGGCNTCFYEAYFGTGYSVNAPGFPYAQPNWTADFFSLVDYYVTERDTLDFSYYTGDINFFGFANGLSGYIGPGTVNVVGFISEDSDVCYGVRITVDCSDLLDLTTTLTYNYEPTPRVPEPGALSIFAVGLLAFTGLSLSRNRPHRGAR